jgi:hypothetical protein
MGGSKRPPSIPGGFNGERDLPAAAEQKLEGLHELVKESLPLSTEIHHRLSGFRACL